MKLTMLLAEECSSQTWPEVAFAGIFFAFLLVCLWLVFKYLW